MADSLDFLERSLYSIAGAARLLQIHSPKLRRWLEGYARRSVRYPPVIRPEVTGSEEVTWGEFVEASLLREYRVKVPLQRLRPVIDVLREEFGVKYPLAHFRPLVDESARELVFEAQKLTKLESDLFLVRSTEIIGGQGWQLQWAAPVAAFLRKIEHDPQGVITRYRPVESSVIIDPAVEFGIPQIHGVRTETLAEAYATGATVEGLAEEWGLSQNEIDAALRWEFLIGRAA
jgi:uncharacterized protein (DUF433 family)